jgi:hypothetical protein
VYQLHRTGGQSRDDQWLPSITGVLIEFWPGFDFTGTFTGTALLWFSKRLRSCGLRLVPVVGLEPTRPFKGPQDFKSCASAISPHRQCWICLDRLLDGVLPRVTIVPLLRADCQLHLWRGDSKTRGPGDVSYMESAFFSSLVPVPIKCEFAQPSADLPQIPNLEAAHLASSGEQRSVRGELYGV